jgi:hypothetical protein
MTGVRIAKQRRVIEEFARLAAGVDAKLHWIEIATVIKRLGPLSRWQQQFVEIGNRAVMQERAGRPDAVARACFLDKLDRRFFRCRPESARVLDLVGREAERARIFSEISRCAIRLMIGQGASAAPVRGGSR